MFETTKITKFVEEDVYEEGCIPETGYFIEIDTVFDALTLRQLLEKILEYHEVTEENIELDACDEKGRLDVCVMEDEYGDKASEEDLKLWKQGRKRLFYVVYIYNIREIKRTIVSLQNFKRRG